MFRKVPQFIFSLFSFYSILRQNKTRLSINIVTYVIRMKNMARIQFPSSAPFLIQLLDNPIRYNYS